jgi:hypothetical protein
MLTSTLPFLDVASFNHLESSPPVMLKCGCCRKVASNWRHAIGTVVLEFDSADDDNNEDCP